MLRRLFRSYSKPIIRPKPEKALGTIQYDNYEKMPSNANTKLKHNRKELSLDSNLNNNNNNHIINNLKPCSNYANNERDITNAVTNDNSQYIKHLSNRNSSSQYTISQSPRILSSPSQSNTNIFLQSEHNKSSSSLSSTRLVNQLEKYIDHIKAKGFKNNEQLLLKKKDKKIQLESSVNKFNNHLAMQSKYNHKQFVSNGVLSHEKGKYATLIEVNHQEGGQYVKEIAPLKREMGKYEPKIDKLNRETDEMNEIIISEDREILRIKGEIQKMNQMNSEVIKEKDKIKAEIVLLKRVSNVVRLKIDDQLKKIDAFVYDVKTLAEKDELYTD